MLTHDLRFEDAYLDPDRAQPGDGDLVAISGWGCGEDIRPGDCLLIGDDGPGLHCQVVKVTSRFARGLFFWMAACRPSDELPAARSKRSSLRLVTP